MSPLVPLTLNTAVAERYVNVPGSKTTNVLIALTFNEYVSLYRLRYLVGASDFSF